MYNCSECDKAFANKSNYNRHRIKFHSEYSDGGTGADSESESILSEEDDGGEESTTIAAAADDEREVDVWGEMYAEFRGGENDMSITDVYKEKVLFLRAMKKDSTHKSIMQTLRKVQDEDGMDFEEALDYAVDKRKFLIHRQIKIYEDNLMKEE